MQRPEFGGHRVRLADAQERDDNLGSRERVLTAVLGDAIRDAERELAETYDQHAPLIRWLVAHELPVPEALHTIAEAALRRRVLSNLGADEASFPALRHHIAEAAFKSVARALREAVETDPRLGDALPSTKGAL